MASSRSSSALFSFKHVLLRSAVIVSCLAACGGSDDAPAAAPADPGPTLRVDGAVSNPSTYNAAQLKALPASTETVTFTSGSPPVPQTHTYTGTRLWDLLNARGIQVSATPYDVLSKLVVATAGSDGYRVLFSTGELHPDFGNRGSAVVYAETAGGVSTPLSGNSYRVTAPKDGKGGRYVSDLVHLEVKPSGSTKTSVGGGKAASFTLTGVNTPATFDLATLANEPVTDVTVGADGYRGTSLWNLINTRGLPPLAGKNPSLRYYVVATATDGAQVVFTLGELDPGFGNEPVLVAYQLNGAPLADNRGIARLVVPNETVRRARWLFNLNSLEVLAVP